MECWYIGVGATYYTPNYYKGQQLEFLTLTKLEVSKDYTFLTLATEEARDSTLEHDLVDNHEKLKVGVTHDHVLAICPSYALVQPSPNVANHHSENHQAVITRGVHSSLKPIITCVHASY